jgi:hypothetical protein
MLKDDPNKLAAIVCLHAVEQLLPRSSSHSDRARKLVSLCGGSSIESLSFTGTLARFDLQGVTFQHCRFEGIVLAQCKFDDKTCFRACRFVNGLQVAHCHGLGRAHFDGCNLDPETEATLNAVRVREGARRYSDEDLQGDIRCVIAKFIIKGGIGIRTVAQAHLSKGGISESPFKDEVLRVLCAMVFEEHPISGASSGYNVRKDAKESVQFYASNNVFTGPLRDAYEKLRKRIPH